MRNAMILFLLVAPLLGCGSDPDFTLKDLEGKEVSLSDFRGRAVLLNFWAVG